MKEFLRIFEHNRFGEKVCNLIESEFHEKQVSKMQKKVTQIIGNQVSERLNS